MLEWYNTVVRDDMGGKSADVLATGGTCWVDVRDVALAHVLMLEKEEAGGERFIVSAGEPYQKTPPPLVLISCRTVRMAGLE